MKLAHPLLAALRLAALLLIFPAWAGAEVPALIRYQGQLTDAQGVPLEGPYDLTFRLYDAETAGTKLWEEAHAAVALNAGQFTVLLGATVSLASESWSQPRWLSTQVGSDAELAPRQRITSVPLAVRAGVAEQLATPVTTSNITDDAHTLVPTGAVILWTGASCPAGYTRLAALDGKFLVGGSGYNASAGGSNTHTHNPGTYATPAHNHGGTTDYNTANKVGSGGADNQYLEPLHPHNHAIPYQSAMTITGASAAVDSRPVFATVLLCQKD